MKKLVFVVGAALVLSACSSRYSSSGEALYLHSHHGVQLAVPPPLTSSNISHFYDLPPQTQNPRVSIVPPSS